MLIGVLLGILVGVLPGLGAPNGVSLLLPLTFGMQPVSAIILLSSMYWGALFGGSVTSILFNIPGEPSSVATTFDGYPMARDGRPTTALATAFGSAAFGALVGVVLITLLASWVAQVALAFGPPEYFAVYLLAFASFVGMGGAPAVQDAGVAGDRLRHRGRRHRHRLGQRAADNGRRRAGQRHQLRRRRHGPVRHRRAADRGRGGSARQSAVSSRIDWREVFRTLARLAAPWLGAAAQRRDRLLDGDHAGRADGGVVHELRHRQAVLAAARDFGNGEPEGIIAPETADHAAGTSALLPMLSLGIPGSATAAVMMGGLMIWGLNPGPMLFVDQKDFVWGLIASMYVGNIVAVVLVLLTVPMFAALMRIPFFIIAPLIFVVCTVGAYAVSNSYPRRPADDGLRRRSAICSRSSPIRSRRSCSRS